MKTTVDLPDHIGIEIKKLAAEQQRSFRSVLVEALIEYLDEIERRKSQPGRKIRWITSNGGLPEGLDVSSREKMYRWFEENE